MLTVAAPMVVRCRGLTLAAAAVADVCARTVAEQLGPPAGQIASSSVSTGTLARLTVVFGCPPAINATSAGRAMGAIIGGSGPEPPEDGFAAEFVCPVTCWVKLPSLSAKSAIAAVLSWYFAVTVKSPAGRLLPTIPA